MGEDKQGPGSTQPTQPTKGEPVEIPVPERDDVMRDLRKMAKPAAPEAPKQPARTKLPPPRRP